MVPKMAEAWSEGGGHLKMSLEERMMSLEEKTESDLAGLQLLVRILNLLQEQEEIFEALKQVK